MTREVLAAVLKIDQEAEKAGKPPVFDSILTKAVLGVHAHALSVLVDRLSTASVNYEVYMPFERSKSRVVLVRSGAEM